MGKKDETEINSKPADCPEKKNHGTVGSSHSGKRDGAISSVAWVYGTLKAIDDLLRKKQK